MTFNPQVRRASRRGMKTAEKFEVVIPSTGIGIEYTCGSRWKVYLDRRVIGHIQELGDYRNNQYQFNGRDGTVGPLFATFAECRASLDHLDS